ncbi:MAG TPA: hypothetical protein VFX70_13490 [Mycobacteriales bacterium]|nr:hypothetical protein [Mycobacteriales bacterium]
MNELPAQLHAEVYAEVQAEVADAGAITLARTIMALAAMHEPGPDGRCRWCRSHRRWRRRRRPGPCRTWRVIRAELRTGGPPRWVPA